MSQRLAQVLVTSISNLGHDYLLAGVVKLSQDMNLILRGWSLQRGSPITHPEMRAAERQIWSDQFGLLAVSSISDIESVWYRVRQIGQVAVDVSFSRRLLVERPISSAISIATLDHFLVDQIFPRILAHEGHLVLHAGAVRCDDCAIVVIGQSGRGKSTLVASLDRAGFGLIGDDALIMSKEDQAFRTRPVYPSLRLFPDSLEALFHDRPATAQVAHYSLKERVILPSTDSRMDPLPIVAIFSLAEPSLDAEIRVTRISPAVACMAIISNSFALDPTDKELARKKLTDAGKLANEVPAYEISYPRDYARIPDVHAAIFEKLAQGRSFAEPLGISATA